MKKIIFLFMFSFLLMFSSFAQLKVWKNNQLSFGPISDPTHYYTVFEGVSHGFVTGSAYLEFQIGTAAPRIFGNGDLVVFYSWKTNNYNDIQVKNIYQYSDINGKKNITPIVSGLNKLENLNPVTYNWKNEDLTVRTLNGEILQEIGFIAQEVEQVIPEAVVEDEEGNKLINYTAIIPILTQAVKELSAEIEELKKEIDRINNNESGIAEQQTTHTKLFQNAPNPFSESTRIGFHIEEMNDSAAIFIFNLEGKMVLKKNIAYPGEGEVIVNANELAAGMYLYSLVVDNKAIDTKRMIITN